MYYMYLYIYAFVTQRFQVSLLYHSHHVTELPVDRLVDRAAGLVLLPDEAGPAPRGGQHGHGALCQADVAARGYQLQTQVIQLQGCVCNSISNL